MLAAYVEPERITRAALEDAGKEYRRMPDGREGTEVIPLKRDDARVESIVLHMIWP